MGRCESILGPGGEWVSCRTTGGPANAPPCLPWVGADQCASVLLQTDLSIIFKRQLWILLLRRGQLQATLTFSRIARADGTSPGTLPPKSR